MEVWILVAAIIAIVSAVGKSNQEKARKLGENPREMSSAERTNRYQTINQNSPKQEFQNIGNYAQSVPNMQSNIPDRKRNQEIVEEERRGRMQNREDDMEQNRKRANENERKHEKYLNQTRAEKTFGHTGSAETDPRFAGYNPKQERHELYQERSKEEQNVQVQKDRAESKQRRVLDDARKVRDELESVRKKEVLARGEDALDDPSFDIGRAEAKSLMAQVNNLIVMGPDSSIPFERDFIGEAMDMLN